MSGAPKKLVLSAVAMFSRHNAFVSVSAAALLRRPSSFLGGRAIAAHVLRQRMTPRAPHYATLATPRVEGDLGDHLDTQEIAKARSQQHSAPVSSKTLFDDVDDIRSSPSGIVTDPNGVTPSDDSDMFSVVTDGNSSSSELSEDIRSSKSSARADRHTVPKKREIVDGMGPPISEFRISEATRERLANNKITQTTEVQAGTFDLIYDGADVIAKSRTGTGKTLAFALPIMERLVALKHEPGRRSSRQGPGCIVLTPTRELAKQVAREMTYIGEGLDLSVECLYGGVSYTPQENALRRGVDIVVGTPGRLIDHLDRGTLRLNSIKFAVLDEADEMLSMGFSDDVENIFQTLPPQEERQVVLFSATVPSWVKSLAAQYQGKDVVLFDSVTQGSMAATTVRHCALRVPERDEGRASFLADIIAVYSRPGEDAKGKEQSRTIVFTETKREADELATSGALEGCGAAVLHGDVSQKQREITLAHFRKGRFQVLVATDVAARGLDISGVDVVVQYRLPQDGDSYIHRAGRTGRAGKAGTAVVMYNDRESDFLRQLERQCKIKFERQPAPAPEMALEAAADVALLAMDHVESRVVNHLIPRAKKIIEESENPAHVVASILAVASRRTELSDRSVLSGEKGMRALLVKGEHDINPGQALRFIGEISRHADVDDRVGLIRACKDGSTILDVPSENSETLVNNAAQVPPQNFNFSLEIATSVPALRENERRSSVRNERQNGRYAQGGRRGRGMRDGRFSDSFSSRDSFSRGGSFRRKGQGTTGGRDSWGRGGYENGNMDDGFGRRGRGGYERDSGRGNFGRDRFRGSRRSSQLLDDDF